MAHGDARGRRWRGKLANWVGSQSPPHRFTLPRNMVYPSLLPLMRTPRLPAVDWTDAPADLNGLVRFAEGRNLVSARVPSHFKRTLLYVSHKLVSLCRLLAFLLPTPSFLSKQTRHGKNIVSFFFSFICSRAKCLSRAMCGTECKSIRLVLQLHSSEVDRTVTSSFVWSWTISVNVNEGIQDTESWTKYRSFVSASFTVYA